jgi:hypothetical protein
MSYWFEQPHTLVLALDFPYRRLCWISQFELDRGLAENADDSGLLAAFLHPVIMRRACDAAYEAAGGNSCPNSPTRCRK